MAQPHYAYIFDDIQDTPGAVQVVRQQAHQYEVAVRDMDFLYRTLPQVPPHIADCIDLAVAVYVADRLSLRPAQRPCHLHIVLPLRYPEVWNSSLVLEDLQYVLWRYTGDTWFFEFRQRSGRERRAALQTCLPLSNDAVEVALWSGGLDSLAGLLNRQLANPAIPYTLFSTGGNSFIHARQQQLLAAAKATLPGPIKLVQVPIHLAKITELPWAKNAHQRARGFVFLLLGAVCAYLEGQHMLHIYENGIGAINLPFRESEVGLDHAVSVHPLSLLAMSRLISTVFGMLFMFQNPFLLATKAEMCAILTKPGLTDLAFETISCDRRHRAHPMQCGACSSCLLRRQALAACGLIDHTPYVVTTTLSRKQLAPPDTSHLHAMLYQIDTLRTIFRSAAPWRELAQRYPTLANIVDRTARASGAAPVMKEQVLGLYERYMREWDLADVRAAVGRGLSDVVLSMVA